MYKIEKDWITNSGLRAVVLMTRGRHRCHRCGYVALPPGHPLNGVKYDDPCDILQDQHDTGEPESAPAGQICPAGLEPAAFGSVDRRSVHLSYGHEFSDSVDLSDYAPAS